MTIIDWMNQLLIYKKPWESFTESDQKSFSPYIVNRFLSMDTEFIEIVNYFQKYSIGLLESKEIYKWYCDILPKGKRFNKYIKGKKSKKYDDELKNILCNYFECSKLQVLDYIELIPEEELKEILGKYGIEPKKIRKLIKW